MNRRNWLKTSALVTGALTLPNGILQQATAAPATAAPASSYKRFSEQAIAREFPTLKARLFANENPFGPSEKAKKAIVDAMANSYQYPFLLIEELTTKITTAEGVTKEQFMIGAGSTPLLQAAAMIFSKGGTGSIVAADPSYDYLPDEAAKFFNAKWVKVPLTPDYKHDLDAMEKAIDKNTSLVYICNPNNPTGTVVDTAKLKAFCERVSKRVPVFVDEAYIDYLPDPQGTTLIDCVKKGHNVIVARTFSKLHGFAGLRVGYIVAQPDMIKSFEPYSSSWGAIAATSANAALASFGDTEFLKEALKKTTESKEYLYAVLKKEGYTYIPSATNFVMFPLNMDSERFVEEMMKRGVGVRSWKFSNKEWCRVSIGRMDEMKAFEEAFKQLS